MPLGAIGKPKREIFIPVPDPAPPVTVPEPVREPVPMEPAPLEPVGAAPRRSR
jgi:hypothetical protein